MKALEAKVQTTVAKVTPGVVCVAGASGVIVNSDGYVLTVAHVGRHAGRNITVILPDGRRARAVTLGNDQGVDAGMVKILDKGPWPSAEMGGSADLKPGQWCITLGYPMTQAHGKPPLARIGRVLSNRKTEIITDCTIMGGDSGAPLFDLDGKIIGIGTKCDNSLVYNIHVPIDRFRETWKRLAEGEDFDSLAPKPAMLAILPAEGSEDARIGKVVPGSGAEKAGLRSGDVLLKFDGQGVHQYKDLGPLLRKRKPGDRVEIEVRRGEETAKLQVTLDEDNTGRNR